MEIGEITDEEVRVRNNPLHDQRRIERRRIVELRNRLDRVDLPRAVDDAMSEVGQSSTEESPLSEEERTGIMEYERLKILQGREDGVEIDQSAYNDKTADGEEEMEGPTMEELEEIEREERKNRDFNGDRVGGGRKDR